MLLCGAFTLERKCSRVENTDTEYRWVWSVQPEKKYKKTILITVKWSAIGRNLFLNLSHLHGRNEEYSLPQIKNCVLLTYQTLCYFLKFFFGYCAAHSTTDANKLDLILMNSAISKSWRGVFIGLMAEVNVMIKRLNGCDSHEGAQSRSMSSSGSLPFPLSIKASVESAVIGVPVWRCVLIYRCGTALKIPN